MLLVVEDDDLALRTVLRLLRADGSVRTASSAGAALSLMMEHDGWAGFLVDVGLPDGNRAGLDLLRMIRAVYPKRPCALLTGQLDREVINSAYRLNAAVIAKPASQEEIDAFVGRLMTAG